MLLQVHAAAADSTCNFNLLVMGESNLGKSTFINALFGSEVYVSDSDKSSELQQRYLSVSVNLALFPLFVSCCLYYSICYLSLLYSFLLEFHSLFCEENHVVV